jgi:hypothetical protein
MVDTPVYRRVTGESIRSWGGMSQPTAESRWAHPRAQETGGRDRRGIAKRVFGSPGQPVHTRPPCRVIVNNPCRLLAGAQNAMSELKFRSRVVCLDVNALKCHVKHQREKLALSCPTSAIWSLPVDTAVTSGFPLLDPAQRGRIMPFVIYIVGMGVVARGTSEFMFYGVLRCVAQDLGVDRDFRRGLCWSGWCGRRVGVRPTRQAHARRLTPA